MIQAISESVRRDLQNGDWASAASIHDLEAILPSGSGIDQGITIDLEESTEHKIVLVVPYHHMDDNGFYDGWSTWKLTITPTFQGFDIDSELTDEATHTRFDEETGEEYDASEFVQSSTLEYLLETVHYALNQEIVHAYIEKENRVAYSAIRSSKVHQ
jgi:hypothetical protein